MERSEVLRLGLSMMSCKTDAPMSTVELHGEVSSISKYEAQIANSKKPPLISEAQTDEAQRCNGKVVDRVCWESQVVQASRLRLAGRRRRAG